MPTLYSKNDFADYCLRALGAPVIQINVDATQLEDRVDEAIKKFNNFHADGSLRDFVVLTITQKDINQGYKELDDDIYTVIRLLPIDSLYNPYNLQFQSYLSNIISNVVTGRYNIGEFLQRESYVNGINTLFNHEKPIRFKQHQKRLYIDTNWTQNLHVNDKIMIECYRYLSPDDNPDIWNNEWLQKYAIALIRRQWGNNVGKYSGFQLPSGMVLEGRQILEDAKEEIAALEEELLTTWEEPCDFLIG